MSVSWHGMSVSWHEMSVSRGGHEAIRSMWLVHMELGP